MHPARCDINYARLISLCHVLTQHAHPYDCIPCISPYPTSALSRVCRDLYHFLSWNMESCVSVAYCPHPEPPMPAPVYRTPLTRCARTLGCMDPPPLTLYPSLASLVCEPITLLQSCASAAASPSPALPRPHHRSLTRLSSSWRSVVPLPQCITEHITAEYMVGATTCSNSRRSILKKGKTPRSHYASRRSDFALVFGATGVLCSPAHAPVHALQDTPHCQPNSPTHPHEFTPLRF